MQRKYCNCVKAAGSGGGSRIRFHCELLFCFYLLFVNFQSLNRKETLLIVDLVAMEG